MNIGPDAFETGMASKTTRPSEGEQPHDKPRTQQQCQRLFERYNRKYFNGRLPDCRIIIVSDELLGSGKCGHCFKRQRETHIGAPLGASEQKIVLLHEMAHAASRSGHGKQWQSEMARLAKMGAPTGRDLEFYQSKKNTMGAKEIANEAFDAGMNSDWSWDNLRFHIGTKYGLTDTRGRALNKKMTLLMRKCRKEFLQGRKCSSGFIEQQMIAEERRNS